LEIDNLDSIAIVVAVAGGCLQSGGSDSKVTRNQLKRANS